MLDVWAHESFMDFNFNYTSLPFYLPTFLPSFPPSLTSSFPFLPSFLPSFLLSFLPSLPPSSFLPFFLSSFLPPSPSLNFFPCRSRMTHSPLLSLPPHSSARNCYSPSSFLSNSLIHFLPPSFSSSLLPFSPSLPPVLPVFLPSFFLSLPLCLLPSPSSPSFFALLLLLFPSFPFLPTSSFLPPLTNNSSSFSYLSPPDHPSDLSFLSLPPSLPGPLIPFSLTQQSS